MIIQNASWLSNFVLAYLPLYFASYTYMAWNDSGRPVLGGTLPWSTVSNLCNLFGVETSFYPLVTTSVKSGVCSVCLVK